MVGRGDDVDDVGGNVGLESGAIDWSYSLALMFGWVDTLSYCAKGVDEPRC
jgi:hypothetical protein